VGVKKVQSSRQFARLADTYREKGELDKAIGVLEKGLEDNPDYITARIILAACFTDQGHLQKAQEEYERVLELDPFHAQAMKKLAKLLLDMNKPEEARQFMVNYLEEVPDDENVRKLLTSLDDRDSSVKEISTEEMTTIVEGDDISEDTESAVRNETTEEREAADPEDQDVKNQENYPDGIKNETLPVQEAASQEAETVKEDEPAKQEPISSDEDELIATMTLAEIYASQGFIEKAIQIYQKILAKEPSNEIARKRIEAIRKGGIEATPGEGSDEKVGGPAEKITGGDRWQGDGAPGEVVEDEEYENFKKWLGNLIKKKDKKENQG